MVCGEGVRRKNKVYNTVADSRDAFIIDEAFANFLLDHNTMPVRKELNQSLIRLS